MVQFNVAALAKFNPRTKRMRSRYARRAPPVRPSKAVEMAYRADLLAIVEHLKAAGKEIAQELRSTWHVGDGWIADSVHSIHQGPLESALQRAAAKFGRIGVTAERLAHLAARKALAGVDQRLAASMQRAVGVDIVSRLHFDPKIASAMASATRANVDLITSIPAQYLDKVRSTIESSFADGLRWEEMTAQIAKVGRVTEERAELIAQDQTAKMNSSFNEVRQTSIGIKRYRWSGVLDQRERKSHIRMEGTVCRWDSPPIVDGEAVHAGQAIRCRCTAIPLIDIDELAPEDVQVAA